MQIIITMAGLGSRFRKAGYDMPKYMIEVKGKTLLEWSMSSLKDFNSLEKLKYIFIVRKEDNAKEFILNKMKNEKVENIKVIEIDELTDGQATTAYLAKDYWDSDDEMIVYNIDTYVEAYTICYKDIKGDGFIPCFNAPGDHWSFVKTDSNNKAIEIREKVKISDNCTIGLYYFKSCKLYENLYQEYYSNNDHLEKNEKYIAPLYNHMLEKNMDIYINILPKEKVHVLGTPEEVEEFKKL